MRQTLSFVITVILTCGCSGSDELPQTDAAPSITLSSPTLTAEERQHRQELIRSELNYYMERHNVQDEGFDMVARYAAEGSLSMADYVPEGAIPLKNMFQWPGLIREGKGVVTDRQGRIIIGLFHADTLVCGLRLDREGTYAGMFNAAMEATGHGSYRAAIVGNASRRSAAAAPYIDSYYEGHWNHDRRDGFGFSVSPTHLKAGWWKAGNFRGERMQYTSERIYGIDISRYQHERGRRVWPIVWRSLRITHLGRRISNQRVNGVVDYPVSFVYIKSTQGKDILNKYYAADYQSCHRAKIPVGAYHFFSTKSDGREQALHFLANTRIQSGDLPPMLDIEPSDEQIEKMGGAEKMFSEIRVWLNTVEAATATRPLLYVNQRFVNTWLDYAPDLKSGYQYWIARYGEYKPDIHLALWQLSADGRVRGIQGDVDLNVFNGYEGQWQEFLREATVK